MVYVKRFKGLKVLHLMLKVMRDILIGKAAAVIGGWVLKNALAMTIAIKKSQMLGVEPDQLYNPKFIKDNHLQLESLVMALMPFLVLLMFSASLGFWAQQGGWGGFVRDHAGLGRGLAVLQRDISMASSTAASLASSTARACHAEAVTGAGAAFEHQVQHGVANLISSPEGTESLREMDNFYKVALAFIPAWAYKDFIAMFLTVFNLWAEPILIFVAGAAGVHVDAEAGMLFSNTTDSSNATTNTTEGDSGLNFAEQQDKIDQEYQDVANGGYGFMTPKKPKGWVQLLWSLLLALLCTGLAAALQLHAHIWVENMDEGRCNYLKVIFTCLQTCMFLGTGYAFWDVINSLFTCSTSDSRFLLIYASSVTVCVVFVQKLLRRLAKDAKPESFLERGYVFLDKSGDFVMAWAWQALLNHMFFSLADVILQSPLGDSCESMYFAHYALNAVMISLSGVLLVTAMEVVRHTTQLLGPDTPTQAAQATTTLVVGINAGWAWLGFISAVFKCDNNFTIGMYWRCAAFTLLVAVVVVFLMELAIRTVDRWIDILGDRIAVNTGIPRQDSGGGDSYFDFGSSEESEDDSDDSDDSDEGSSDGFKDPKQQKP